MLEKAENKINRLKHVTEDVFLYPRGENENTRRLLKKSIEEEAKSKKIMAILEIIRSVLPKEITELIRKKFLVDMDFEKLPFDLKKLPMDENRIGKGFVSEVFLLQSMNESIPSYVLKIDYIDRGTTDKLYGIALSNKKEYEEVSWNYREVEDLILEEYQIIAESPKTKKPAIVTVQRFIGEDIQDIFTIDEAELVDILRKDDHLRSSFHKFMEVSLKLWQEEGKIIDLSGENNLIIAKQKENKNSLIFLDPHNISSTHQKEDKRIKKLEDRLIYLKNIYDHTK